MVGFAGPEYVHVIDDETSGDSEGGTSILYHDNFDWSSVRPSTAIVEALETVTNRDQVTFDPEALATVLRGGSDSESTDRITVSFDFCEHAVTARSDGKIVVTEVNPEGDTDEVSERKP